MAVYKDRWDKSDIKYLGIRFFVANVSNLILEFLDKNNSIIKHSILWTSVAVVVLILITPFLLHLFSGPMEKKMIALAYKFKSRYNIIGITMFAVCLVYMVYAAFKFYLGTHS